MTDGGESDEKIIAVPVKDPNNDLPKNTVTEIIHFLKFYKAHDPKNVIEVKPAGDVSLAKKLIAEAKEYYGKGAHK
jgi:inorganic pyrophosphatase